MEKSTPRSKSKVFIAGFRHFQLAYVPSKKQVVSEFQGVHEFPWTNADFPLFEDEDFSEKN